MARAERGGRSRKKSPQPSRELHFEAFAPLCRERVTRRRRRRRTWRAKGGEGGRGSGSGPACGSASPLDLGVRGGSSPGQGGDGQALRLASPGAALDSVAATGSPDASFVRVFLCPAFSPGLLQPGVFREGPDSSSHRSRTARAGDDGNWSPTLGEIRLPDSSFPLLLSSPFFFFACLALLAS